jgi:hypothetical protein
VVRPVVPFVRFPVVRPVVQFVRFPVVRPVVQFVRFPVVRPVVRGCYVVAPSLPGGLRSGRGNDALAEADSP